MDFSNYLFRCHMVGKINAAPKPLTDKQKKMLEDYNLRDSGEGRPLTDKQIVVLNELRYKNDQSKIYKLSDSQKKLLSKLAWAERFNRRVEINSSKLTKGIEIEKECRDILSRVTGLWLTAKKERKSNLWVTGEIDIEPNDVIVDIKSAWSWESYSEILESATNQIYLDQGDSYMDLWGKEDFLLCHVLTSTPFDLVNKELRSLDYHHDIINVGGEIREDDRSIGLVKRLISNHIFTREALERYTELSSVVHIEWFDDYIEIPEEDRVHMIPHKLDKARLEQRNKSIEVAREYMNGVNAINNFNQKLIA